MGVVILFFGPYFSLSHSEEFATLGSSLGPDGSNDFTVLLSNANNGGQNNSGHPNNNNKPAANPGSTPQSNTDSGGSASAPNGGENPQANITPPRDISPDYLSNVSDGVYDDMRERVDSGQVDSTPTIETHLSNRGIFRLFWLFGQRRNNNNNTTPPTNGGGDHKNPNPNNNHNDDDGGDGGGDFGGD